MNSYIFITAHNDDICEPNHYNTNCLPKKKVESIHLLLADRPVEFSVEEDGQVLSEIEKLYFYDVLLVTYR